jgi:hypothetical protein
LSFCIYQDAEKLALVEQYDFMLAYHTVLTINGCEDSQANGVKSQFDISKGLFVLLVARFVFLILV